jgi:transposase
MEQLCHQVAHKAIPIFETLHPNSQAVFVFDCLSAHGAYTKSALRVHNMNLNPGGKQSILRDTFIPTDDPLIPLHLRGKPQKLVFDHSHPLHPGKAKGVRAILEESGLWNHYHQQAQQAGQPALKFQCTTCSTSNIKKDILWKSQELISQAKANRYFLSDNQSVKEVISTSSLPQEADIDPATVNTQADNISKSCCWSMILSQQSDFLTERPLLQTIIEDAGHICLFLPKFHCELNPIELFWSYIKTGKDHFCFDSNFKSQKLILIKLH